MMERRELSDMLVDAEEQRPQLPAVVHGAVARVTAGLPALPPEAMVNFKENLQLAIDGGMAQATLDALHSDGVKFARWCAAHGQDWLPADPRVVAAFLKEMGKTYKPATLDRFTFSIRTWHMLAELPLPTKSIKVKMVRKAQAREFGRVQKQATGLTWEKIERIAETIDAKGGKRTLADFRDKALLMVAYNALARESEIVQFRWDDLSEDGAGGWVIAIRRSKTDQEGQGAFMHLWPATVEALQDWKRAHDRELARRQELDEERIAAQVRKARRRDAAPIRTKTIWVETPFVFRGLRDAKWTEQLSTRAIDDIIKARVAAAGILDQDKKNGVKNASYSGHSMRVGAAQDLVAAGEDIGAIMRDGRWKTPMMVMRYSAKLMASRGAMARLGRKRAEEAADDRPQTAD
jgi:integrase